MSRPLDPARFTAEKLLWQRLVLQDPSINAFAKVLAAFLTHSLNEKRGGAWMSQPELASRLGVDVRTIRRATADLVEAKWLTVTVSKGRGRSNVYRAILNPTSLGQQSENPADELTSDARGPMCCAPDNRTYLTAGQGENRTPLSQDGAENRTTTVPKPDERARPILIETNSPLPPTSSADRGSSRPDRCNSRTGRLTRSSSLRRFPEDTVRMTLLAAKGQNFVCSYLDPASWHVEGRAIMCWTKFAAHKLREECGAELARLGVIVGHGPMGADAVH